MDKNYPVYKISYIKSEIYQNIDSRKYLFLCGLHGNEPAPVFGIKNIIQEINEEKIKIPNNTQVDFIFIMNPFAGQKRANKFLPEIIAMYNRAGYDVTAYMTGGPGDAIQTVQRLAPQMDLIVACGGDGTLNRFANSVAEIEIKCNVLYFAQGSGNDFLRDIGAGFPGNRRR